MAKLTREELVRVNQQLVAVGERICPGCGIRKPLTTDFWYQTTPTTGRAAGKTLWQSRCRVCTSARTSENSRRRYRLATVKARKAETARAWRKRNRDKDSAAAKRYRRNKLKRKLTAALKGAA